MSPQRVGLSAGRRAVRRAGRAWRVRVFVRLILVVALASAGLVVEARPAAAGICSDAPAPIAPKSGLPGMVTARPPQVPDAAPDPFADPSVPIGDVYGYNWQWANYDLGCGSDFLSDPIAVTNTQTANVVMSITGVTLAQLNLLEFMAKGTSVEWLTKVITGIADKLSGPLLGLWLPVALLGVGLIIGFRAKRSSYADTMRSMLVIVGAVALAAFALLFPTTLSNGVDRGVVGVANVAGQQFSASGSDAVTRESAYRTWLTGNFGDPDSAVAKELGPRLMSATHYTWSDMKRIESDPGARKQIDRDKANEFKQVADQLKAQDPAAYEMFTGRGERTGPALFGVLVVLAMSLFVGLAMLMVMIARVMMQGLALAAPLAAVLGVLPTHTSVLRRLWDLFTASVVAVAKFVIAGGVMALILGAIQANQAMGGGAKLFWVLVATVVALMLTRPIRSFKTIIPGLDPSRSYVRAAASGVASYFGARVGTEQGVHAAADALPAAEQAGPPPVVSSEARESLAALPAPQWQTRAIGPAYDQSAATYGPMPQPVAVGSGALPAAPAGALTAAPASTLPSGPSEDRRHGVSWPGVAPAARPAVAAVPAGPIRTLDEPADGTSSPAASSASSSEAPSDTPRLAAVSAANVERSGLAADQGRRLMEGAPPRPGIPAQAGSEVVYPTGVIVAGDDAPLYRRSHEVDAAGVYVPAAELELDADGREQPIVRYRSPRREPAHAPA